MVIETSMKDIQQQLKDEQEQKVCFQKEARDNLHVVKLLEEESMGLQSQLEEFQKENGKLQRRFEEYKMQLGQAEQEREINEAELQSQLDTIQTMEKQADQQALKINTLEEDMNEKCDHINEEKTKSQTQFDQNQDILAQIDSLKEQLELKEVHSTEASKDQEKIDELIKELQDMKES